MCREALHARLDEGNQQPLTLISLHQNTEGWVAGLRLASLALRHHSDADTFLRGFKGNARAIQDYLVDEVLSQLPPAAVDYLGRASVFERFSASLCEQVCRPQGDSEGGP